MIRSMYSGISGLQVHQTKMDVIGNNIANVNTVGFKASNINFSDILYQTSQNASAPTKTSGGTNAKQVGLGAAVAGITSTVTKQGGVQRTDAALDLTINGDAFFIVQSNGQQMFTKNGAFQIDENGNLATEGGALVMGWPVNKETDSPVQGQVTKLTIKSKENMSCSPEATTNVVYAGNIDATDEELIDGKNVQMEFYDNRGDKYTVKYKVKATSTDGTDNGKYSLDIVDIVDENGKSIFINEVTDPTSGKIVKQANKREVTMGGKTYHCELVEGVTANDGSPVFKVCSDIGDIQDADNAVQKAKTKRDNLLAEKTKKEDNLSDVNDRLAEVTTEKITEAETDCNTKKTTFEGVSLSDPPTEAEQTAYNEAKAAYEEALEKLEKMKSDAETYPSKKTELENQIQQLDLDIDDANDGVTKAEAALTSTRNKYAQTSEKYPTIESMKDIAYLNFDVATGKFIGTLPANEDRKRDDMMTLKIFQEAGVNDERFKDIEVDFSTMTSYNSDGVSTMTASKGDLENGLGAGCKMGKLTKVTVSDSGIVSGVYNNGKTMCLGQIAVATFTNPAGLEAVGNSMYTTSQNSGDFDGVGIDISTTGGKISTGVLELSNVDLSNEFTNMVTAQRGFQANSRIITTSDSLLEELVNLKR